jgi:hypothetical protein
VVSAGSATASTSDYLVPSCLLLHHAHFFPDGNAFHTADGNLSTSGTCAAQILIWFTQDRASTRDAAHRALPCHARSRSHQDHDETLALASIQRLDDPARPVRAPCVGDRDCNERSTISGHDAGAPPRAVWSSPDTRAGSCRLSARRSHAPSGSVAASSAREAQSCQLRRRPRQRRCCPGHESDTRMRGSNPRASRSGWRVQAAVGWAVTLQ